MSEPKRPRSRWFYLWLVATLAWMGFIGWRAHERWPRVPLDMSALDPETKRVFTEALVSHVLHAALIGLGIPLAVYVVGKILGRIAR